MSQINDSPIPTITPASTPRSSVPAMAATAIQKSKGCTRRSRRISGTSIIPITTASMISAASTGLGRSENSGARKRRVRRTIRPDVIEARPVRAPLWSFNELAERLVETGMPCTRPAPTFAMPCATDSWLMSMR